MTRNNINALRLQQVNLQDRAAMEQHIFYQLQTFPSVREVLVLTNDPALIYLVGHKFDGGFISNTMDKFPIRERYELDDQGKRKKLLQSITIDFDPLNDPTVYRTHLTSMLGLLPRMAFAQTSNVHLE